jgi:hypothetical protein
MRARILWKDGGEAELVALSEDRVELVSTAPFPPGSRPEGTLSEPPAPHVRLKVHRSSRQEDGRYRVWGRLLDVSREVREFLLKRLGRSSDAPP